MTYTLPSEPMQFADNLAEAITADWQYTTATRVPVLSTTPEALGKLTVQVCPVKIERTAANRKEIERKHELHVLIGKLLDPTLEDDLEVLIAQAVELGDVLDQYRQQQKQVGTINANPKARIINVQNDPLYSHPDLSERNLFCGLIKVTMRVLS